MIALAHLYLRVRVCIVRWWLYTWSLFLRFIYLSLFYCKKFFLQFQSTPLVEVLDMVGSFPVSIHNYAKACSIT